MNTKQLRKMIDKAFLKVGDRQRCNYLMCSVKMDFDHMATCRTHDDTSYLMREVNRKRSDIINMIRGA